MTRPWNVAVLAGAGAGAAEVLRRGVRRGELRADLDVDVAIDALYYRLLVSHEPLNACYTDAVVDQVFPGLAVVPHPVADLRSE